MLLLTSLCETSTAQIKELYFADSLFSIGQYSAADEIYKKSLTETKKYNAQLLLKLAFMAEKAEKPAEALYYLSIVSQKEPNLALSEKMNQIAVTNGLEGYSFDDFSYFLVFYRQYGGYIPILLLTLGIYVVLVMILKVRNREIVQRRHKLAVIAYLVAMLGLLNIPESYHSGVVKSRFTFVRAFPSAAAPVVETIRQGHKLTVIGKRDEWNRVIWQGKILFIKHTDLWII